MDGTRKRRGGRLWIAVLVVGAVLVGIGLAWPKPRLLLERARPVATVRADSDGWEDEWDWFSDSELLLLTTDQFAEKSAGWRGHVERIDVATGKRTPQPGLTALLTRDHLSPEGTPDTFQLSPDHNWLVWDNYTESQGQDYGAAHLDGTGYRTWRIEGQCDSFFVDGSHWAHRDIGRPDKITIRDLQDAKRDRAYSVTAPPAKEALARRAAQMPEYVDVAQVFGAPPGQFMINIYRTEDTLKAMSYDNRDSIGPTPLRRHLVRLPEGATVEDQGVDKGNACVYYHLRIVAASPFLAWLHRNLSRFAVPTTDIESLWVSRTDGQDLHEIGHLPARRAETADEGELTSIEWLPGGKKLSFLYKDTLYVVPIEPQK